MHSPDFDSWPSALSRMLFIATLTTLQLLAGGARAQQEPAAEAPVREVVIFSTQGVRGEIAPCG